ncbi:hypothetical protein MYCTH_2123311 [Thermothelomyces thermophilus ATCC 42464]|uniref:Uncharacterized protein n=1 Tax=Thermothelomyces thermophilus (strain ATCC 42464 / BCRC 31852 / DSM 1799) TaxID=573729 RepID=G2Q3R8_THET4|nr:uncharacterized protein MYCTH_2123311 [Thermothelomyces thermophilus ATCC 42464]AEO54421.1 hypothetical protein MYCTH_2123311 [Thermothelomyces thermophilus ATCC 42464]
MSCTDYAVPEADLKSDSARTAPTLRRPLNGCAGFRPRKPQGPIHQRPAPAGLSERASGLANADRRIKRAYPGGFRPKGTPEAELFEPPSSLSS